MEPKVTAGLVAEAAAWLAILHGPNRSIATERGFSQWLKKSASHARAFEEATGIWEEARGLPRLARSSAVSSRKLLYRPMAIAATILVALAVGITFYLRSGGITTNIGEQRTLALEDGTQVVLNTNTQIVVTYNRKERRIELKSGEALFEVAAHPAWPFVVIAGHRQVRALGTSFVVRREHGRLAVTVVEGRVSVAGRVLAPGERAVFPEAQTIEVDRPPLDKLLAWQRREVALDNTALADAVAEMNRYNRKPLVVSSAVAENVRVTGLFRAGDSMSFARAVAEAYELGVTEEPDRILLSGTPHE
jgi:transmembrane sensor